jgi:hypothetical protein
MESFSEKYTKDIYGTLHGFDRIILKGFIRDFHIDNKFYYFLSQENTNLVSYKSYVLKKTQELKSHIESIGKRDGINITYINSPKIDKGKLAEELLQANGNKEGLICIISSVEPCYAMTVRGNRETKLLEKRFEYRKCSHYYLYYNDRDFGFMYVRVQAWLPYQINIYINGKSYVMQQLKKAGIEYKSYRNSITYVSDIQAAQKYSNQIWEKKFFNVFDRFAKNINPFTTHIEEIFGRPAYSWCIDECEFASDVLFRDRSRLSDLFPVFVEYASLCQAGENIYTFFGRHIHSSTREAVSDRKYYWEQGFRVKFTVGSNSLKIYDKSSVLRVETTINDTRAFKIRNQGKWLPMGKSLSNIYRIAEIGQKCNERYLDSLAICRAETEVRREIEELCNPQKTKLSKFSQSERQYSAFNPLKDSTCKLFYAVMNGAYHLKAFTNQELTKALIRIHLFTEKELVNRDKLRAKVGRLLAKLRAHKLIEKFPHTFKYRVTGKGAEVISAILEFKKMNLKFC